MALIWHFYAFLFIDFYWVISCLSIIYGISIIELDDGKFYRKALYLMVKTMVSCKFSLKPIH
jgi:hypothetical protein